MQEQKENESGSMMLEIIAVLAILAIMTPIVYQQSLKRSREVSNVNMADEMRSVKNAVKAYLDANQETILQACGSPDKLTNCTDYITISDIDPFFLRGTNYEFGTTYTDNGDEDYIVQVYGTNTPYTVNAGTANEEMFYKPNLFAILSSRSQPADLKKGRAMKIASLVGAAGGICDSNSNITGSYGSWGLATTEVDGLSNICFENNTIVVRTDM